VDITDLLILARERDASDLHLTVGSPPRLRLRGELMEVDGWPPLTREELHAMLYDILTDAQKAQFEEHLDLDFALELQNLGRFRVNIFHQRTGEGAAFRVIPSRIRSLEELGLPPVLRELALREHGLILVTGPAGCGKSTTLAAMVDLINQTRRVHIITIEDPIEYLHEHKRSIVNQRELGFDTQSFPNALRSALREDPNVIRVGEMRDLETIALALTAAETGHLVLATLHTGTAAQSVDRIIDVFPPHQQQQIRVQLANVLEAVISQQLLPNQLFLRRFGSPEQLPGARRERGVRTVSRTWPTLEEVGRVPAVEVMIATPAIRNLIREGKTHQIDAAIQTGYQHGMQTMDQSLRDLYERGLISFEDAISRAIRPDELRKMIAGHR
jgi:twitching motility protein PilT